jgi:hypothetical protein
MNRFLALIAIHVVLLVLASSSFTVVTGLGDQQFQWEYFRYLSQRTWGAPRPVVYSLPVVLAYLAAYSTGVAAYFVSFHRGSPTLGLIGIMFCIIGLVSFALELSHWFIDHQRTWIASAPIALLAIAIATAIQQWRNAALASMKAPVGIAHANY